MSMKINKKDLLRFLFVFISILFKYIEMWSYSLSNTFQKSNIIMILIVVISFFILFDTKFLRKDLKKIFILLFLCLIMTIITKSTNFFMSYLFTLIFVTCDDGDEKFFKYFMYSSLILFCITLILNVFGIIPSMVIVRYSNGSYIYRNNFGFYGANSLFLNMFPIIICYITLYYMKNKKSFINILLLIVITIISYLFYKATDCRAGMLSVAVAVIICNFDKLYKNKVVKFITKYYFIFFLMFGIILSHFFGNTTSSVINRLSSGRMYYWNYYVNNVGINLLGNNLILGFPLDNLYLNTLYIYGVICYLINLIITVWASKSMLKNKKTMFIILAFAFYSFFENNVAFNYNFVFTLQMFYIFNSNLKLVRIGDEDAKSKN